MQVKRMWPGKATILVSKESPYKQISYWRWVKAVHNSDGRTTTRVVNERKTASAAELLSNLTIAPEKLSVHLNTASWQLKFYQKKRQKPLAGEISLLMDFDGNYRSKCQNLSRDYNSQFQRDLVCLVTTG